MYFSSFSFSSHNCSSTEFPCRLFFSGHLLHSLVNFLQSPSTINLCVLSNLSLQLCFISSLTFFLLWIEWFLNMSFSDCTSVHIYTWCFLVTTWVLSFGSWILYLTLFWIHINLEVFPNIYFMCLNLLFQGAFFEFQFKFSEYVANLWTTFQSLFSAIVVVLPMFS